MKKIFKLKKKNLTVIPSGPEVFFVGRVFVFFVLFCFVFYKFIYSLAVLGLHCCTQAFSSCGEQELLFIAVHRLLIAVASLVAEHRL